MRTDASQALRLEFPLLDRGRMMEALDGLRRLTGRSVTVLRGRIMPQSAWLEVEWKGGPLDPDGVLRLGRRCGASIRRIV